jgi:hypothetical protein
MVTEAFLVICIVLGLPAFFVLLFAAAWIIRGRWHGGRAI